MRVLVAGATGAIGKSLVPELLESGHEIVALVRNPEKAGALEAMGARVAIADVLNRQELTAAVSKAEPEVVMHQLTSLTGPAT